MGELVEGEMCYSRQEILLSILGLTITGRQCAIQKHFRLFSVRTVESSVV